MKLKEEGLSASELSHSSSYETKNDQPLREAFIRKG